MTTWSGSVAGLNKASKARLRKIADEQFYTDAIQPSGLAQRRFFLEGNHHVVQRRLPDQVVRADPWTLFCAECSPRPTLCPHCRALVDFVDLNLPELVR